MTRVVTRAVFGAVARSPDPAGAVPHRRAVGIPIAAGATSFADSLLVCPLATAGFISIGTDLGAARAIRAAGVPIPARSAGESRTRRKRSGDQCDTDDR